MSIDQSNKLTNIETQSKAQSQRAAMKLSVTTVVVTKRNVQVSYAR